MLSRRFYDLCPGDMFEAMCFDGDHDHDYCRVLVIAVQQDEPSWLYVTFLTQHGNLRTERFHDRAAVQVLEAA